MNLYTLTNTCLLLELLPLSVLPPVYLGRSAGLAEPGLRYGGLRKRASVKPRRIYLAHVRSAPEAYLLTSEVKLPTDGSSHH